MPNDPNDPIYDAVVIRATVHLQAAWDAFQDDPAMPWREIKGNAPKARVRAWVDALKQELAHRQQIEGLLP